MSGVGLDSAPQEFVMKPVVALTFFLLLAGCSTITFPTMVFVHPVTGATGDCPGRTITANTPSGRKAEVILQDRCVRTWLAAGYVRVK
jgi:hypothetical protein